MNIQMGRAKKKFFHLHQMLRFPEKPKGGCPKPMARNSPTTTFAGKRAERQRTDASLRPQLFQLLKGERLFLRAIPKNPKHE
jgi:hypothetical protein